MTNDKNAKEDERYGDNEAQARFQSALKGAFTAPHTPLKTMPPRGMPSQSKKKKPQAKAERAT